ncbi:MAG: hypothetical protein GTN53_10600, partial [Candidatus Aminicenantes bacterium]|nr:hypothetical protein [Candidatus Aminicenantes bacterium]NIQ66901.1 hypothetical protein [Candidatus Aminicenantes bacterium]NIT22944.1 hypothetical protein [Candidatus Aminicenantes bacterium]
MRKLLTFFVIVMFLSLGSTCLYSKVKVGEHVFEKVDTPHPYPGRTVFEHVFHYPNAGYISIHFSKFDLARGDYVEISSPDGKFYYTYREKGKVVRGGAAVLSEFWATHIPGDTAILRLYSHSRKGGWGFEIDQWVRGFEPAYIDAVLSGLEEDAQLEAICNNDDKEWAKCYEGTTMYDKARAVCRLLMNGSSACTGWLLGSEGHVMTNNHCIGSQSTADNTDYEFMAEGATCTTNCTGWLACPGIVEATSGTLIKNDYNLDYTLILLPTNITGTYGYLQLRDTLPIIGERMYIPQHPGAWGKQLAVDSDVDGGYCVVYSTNQTPCIGGPGDIGYYCDTAGGSSGSPVLAYDDHLVISLHHCANCPNRGLPIPAIISHLGSALPNDAIGGPVTPPAAPTGLTANAVACDQIDLSWTDNADNESGFKIERSPDGTNFSQMDTVGANVTNYSDTTVAENTTYWYRVKAYNSAGDSAYSNTANATTPTCPVEPPAAPTNLKAKQKGKRIELTWTDNSNDEDGFRIYRGLSPTTLAEIGTVGPNTT